MKQTFERCSGLLLCTLGLLNSGCYNDNAEQLYPATCPTDTVTYTNAIAPLMAQHCSTSGCHNPTDNRAGIDVSGYAGTKRIADDGSLVGSVTHASGFANMPQSEPRLPECDIEKIKKWVADGAPNN